ncbi:MAG: hypothetical protein HHJ12_16460 [Glaciimonas sp.]|nr:hypothetical protein [Glaciimonas sp.]
MIRKSFRPWGALNWMLPRYPNARWAFIGSAAMEDRCLAARQMLNDHNANGASFIFRIQDGFSRFTDEVERKTNVNQDFFIQLGVQPAEIKNYELLGRDGNIFADINTFLNTVTESNLVIDISCLPKKIFFLLIRLALETPGNIRNILVTYTEPMTYCTEPLAENPSNWAPLPGFLSPRPEPTNKCVIIGLGYEPLGLPELYSSGLFKNSDIRLVFPFPAKPSSVSRNWEFARLLEPVPGHASRNIERVDPLNVPDLFDKLAAITGAGSTHSILAPFGPKPMSLAMCLFASAYSKRTQRPAVYYTQPTVYNPEYSQGVKQINGVSSVFGYCVRLNGTNLYTDPEAIL